MSPFIKKQDFTRSARLGLSAEIQSTGCYEEPESLDQERRCNQMTTVMSKGPQTQVVFSVCRKWFTEQILG